MKPEDLKKWASDNTKYITIKDGESFIGRLDSFRQVTSSFDKEKTNIEYTFTLEDGKQKTWENGSSAVAASLADQVGKTVELTRSGVGPKTKYAVSVPDVVI